MALVTRNTSFLPASQRIPPIKPSISFPHQFIQSYITAFCVYPAFHLLIIISPQLDLFPFICSASCWIIASKILFPSSKPSGSKPSRYESWKFFRLPHHCLAYWFLLGTLGLEVLALTGRIWQLSICKQCVCGERKYRKVSKLETNLHRNEVLFLPLLCVCAMILNGADATIYSIQRLSLSYLFVPRQETGGRGEM